MTIHISGNKQIKINDTIFSLNDLKLNREKYIYLMTPFFRNSTLHYKTNETDEEYLTRLFYLMYYSKGVAYLDSDDSTSVRTRANNITSAANQMPGSDFDKFRVMRTNQKSVHIIFKNGHEYNLKKSVFNSIIETLQSAKEVEHDNLNIKFGVELEFVGERFYINSFNEKMNELVSPDRYSAVYCYNHNEGDKWVLGRDGSISTNVQGFTSPYGFELTSPILDFNSKKDLDELKNVLDLINVYLHGRATKSCGTHIHMSFDTKLVTSQYLKYFVGSYHNCEESLFDRLVPENRKLSNSRWCRSANPTRLDDRYRKLNILHAHKNQHNLHLEFRQLDGTLDYDKIISWVKTQKLFVETVSTSAKNIDHKDTERNKDLIPHTDISINLEDVICDKSIDENDVESLFKMCKAV